MNEDKTARALARYIVGIDLGTTNCAVMSIDTHRSAGQIELFPLFEQVAPGESENRRTLPSFLFLEESGEASGQNSVLKVGVYARDYGAFQPGRLIASAKSWLCHTQVDRTAAFLPWKASEGVKPLSPVDASAEYLRFMAAAWDSAHPDFPLSQQDVVITLPASFDETARELTVRAAAKAGLNRIALIEEPQAAFYAWIYKRISSSQGWDNIVKPGDKILVIDVGGGTSDFTLIQVQPDANYQTNRQVTFHRIAVGEHLILGGDNLDLALAKYLEGKFAQSGVTLTSRQWQTLVRQSRAVKETLLGENAPDSCPAAIPTSGSKLIGGSIHETLTKQEAESILLDGFFPQVELSVLPDRRRSGFQEFGLPFASDAGITRYLASFLSTHRYTTVDGEMTEAQKAALVSDPARPDAILFNGGMFESPLTRRRIVNQIEKWFPGKTEDGQDWSPRILDNDALDLAVARGAAYFGRVRRPDLDSSSTPTVKIHAALARSYYIALEQNGTRRALCVAPAKLNAGDSLELDSLPLKLQVGVPVEFPLYVSSARTTDPAGAIIDIDENQMRALAPLRTIIRGKVNENSPDDSAIPILLKVSLSEIGSLELLLKSRQGKQQWRLDFDIRAAVETETKVQQTSAEMEGALDEQIVQSCREVLQNAFGEKAELKPSETMKLLTAALGQGRDAWPAPFLRSLGNALLDLQDGRTRSVAHESRWLNLLGFCLRPGFGAAMDDWRIEQVWKGVYGKLKFPNPDNRLQLWILWRRIAGGLSAGRQIQITEPVLRQLRTLSSRLKTGRGRSDWTFSPNESAEIFRLFGAMEKLPVEKKEEIGTILLDLLSRKEYATNIDAILWTLGRIGARSGSVGALEAIIPPETAQVWIKTLLRHFETRRAALFAAVMMSRKTSDRYRDVSDSCRNDVFNWLNRTADVSPHWITLVQDGGNMELDEQSEAFGESLPAGLSVQ